MSLLSPTGLAYLTTDELESLYSPDEFEPLGKERITAEAHAFISGYAGTGEGHGMNLEAFKRWVFRPRI